MAKSKYMNRTCEECGQPHTPCKMDEDGIYLCHDCQADEAIIKERIAYLRGLKRRTDWRSEAYRSQVQIEQLQARLKEINA